jgi:dehydrogenase/reductase SDR family protein 12
MIRLDKTIVVACPTEQAFRYLADFRNIVQWDTSVRCAVQTTPGAPGVGTHYELVLELVGQRVPMSYTIAAHAPARRLVLEGRGRRFRVVDRIVVEPATQGARIHYQAAIRLEGPWSRLQERALAPFVEQAGRRAMDRLANVLSNRFEAPRLSAGTRLADYLLLPGLLEFTRWGYRRGRRRCPLGPRALAGKRLVLTGGTSGIGLAAAAQILRLGGDLVLVGRDSAKTMRIATELAAGRDEGRVETAIADLSLMGDVRALAQELLARYPRIDVLINNAGALYNTRQETVEGIERTLATDLLGPFLLTEHLLPRLAQSRPARVINVSSGGMYTQAIVPDDLAFARTPYNGAQAYARAKRGLVILTALWAETWGPRGVAVHAMHPGWVNTSGLREALPVFFRWLRPWLRTPSQGADTISWLAAAPEAAHTGGLFWLDRRPRTAHVFPGTRETSAMRGVFWQALCALAGLPIR